MPVALLELAMQFFGGVGPLGPLGSTMITESVGLQYPSRCARNFFGRLYPDRDGESAVLCTDAYGTIEPTSLRALKESPPAAGAPYLLACGGSTTEMTSVQPEDRGIVLVAKSLGVPAINAGASAKTLATCARSIDFLLQRAPPQHEPLILISTSVNTMGAFLAARFPGWDGGPIPIQPYAPAPLHPALRAWIPGLYHLATTTVAAMKTGPAATSYADALAAGCCHMAAAANRTPSQRFDWSAEENRELYARFVALHLEVLDGVLSKHHIAPQQVVFFVEPNSYGYAAMPHLARDFRQRLHGLDGKPLDFATAATLTASYDDVYARVVSQRFQVIRGDALGLPASAFYDAVHLTPSGAHALADGLAPLLHPKLTGP